MRKKYAKGSKSTHENPTHGKNDREKDKENPPPRLVHKPGEREKREVYTPGRER